MRRSIARQTTKIFRRVDFDFFGPSIEQVLYALILAVANLVNPLAGKNMAAIKDGDTIANLEGAVDVVGHDHDGNIHRLAQSQDEIVKRRRDGRIESG